MKRTLLVAALLLVVSACEKPGPPLLKVEKTPEDNALLAGTTYSMSLIRPITYKEKIDFAWTIDGPCKGELDTEKGFKATFTPEATCEGGAMTLTVVATSPEGAQTFSEEITVEHDPNVIGELPARFEPFPISWLKINDFDKIDAKSPKNDLDATMGTWDHKDGKCTIAAKPSEDGVLQLDFVLPHPDLSSCGYYEYLKEKVIESDDKTKKKKKKKKDEEPEVEYEAVDFNMSPYKTFSFMVKSGDDKVHPIRFEVVEFDSYAQFNQGRVITSKVFEAGPTWRRYHINLDTLCATIDRSKIKSIGFKLDRKDDIEGKGSLLFDNFAFVKRKD